MIEFVHYKISSNLQLSSICTSALLRAYTHTLELVFSPFLILGLPAVHSGDLDIEVVRV